MDAARFDKTRRIIELTEGLPDVACQLAYAYLQGLAEGRRLAQAEKKKKEADKNERGESGWYDQRGRRKRGGEDGDEQNA